MHTQRRVATACLLLTVAAASLSAATIDQRVDALVARMTLEEKLGQLLQYTPGAAGLEDNIARGQAGSVFSMRGVEQTNALQRIAMEKSRLRIPLLFGHDVIHGYRTVFPIPIGIASTWDPASAELAARIAAREARAAGIRWTFSPMVDIARDPRWGRIAEGAGEDPFLGSAMAAAYVRGYQGKDLGSDESIMACAKHFAAYGAAEGGREYNSVDMSERMLREVYLQPFKAAVDAGVGTLMSSFNTVNGVPASANRHLLGDVLRREWRFSGFVVSDYAAVAQLAAHGVAATGQDAARKAITAGVDMDMVDGTYSTLSEAVRDGRLPVAVVDRAVRRVLRAKFELGLFEKPYTDEGRQREVHLTREHLEAARRIAQKSIVLLKNDGGALPLAKNTGTIGVIGPLADAAEDMLGSWYAAGKGEEAVSPLAGIRAAVSPQTRVLYAKGSDLERVDESQLAEAVEVAKKSDVVLMFLGEAGDASGEAASRVSLDLARSQQKLFDAVIATGKPAVLVMLSGRPLTIESQVQRVAGVVWAWFPGTEAGHALADILFGDVNPSGKLPVTIPRSVGQIPIYHSQLPTGRPADPDDRFTSKYLDSPNTPLFAFGQGLSYTTFEYANLRVSPASMKVNGSIVVSADVRNSGKLRGDEVVQLYVNDPVASVSRPVKELKGFQRITLAPGEKRRVEFKVTRAALQFWGPTGWVVEPGTFKVWIGPSSASGPVGEFSLLPR